MAKEIEKKIESLGNKFDKFNKNYKKDYLLRLHMEEALTLTESHNKIIKENQNTMNLLAGVLIGLSTNYITQFIFSREDTYLVLFFYIIFVGVVIYFNYQYQKGSSLAIKMKEKRDASIKKLAEYIEEYKKR